MKSRGVWRRLVSTLITACSIAALLSGDAWAAPSTSQGPVVVDGLRDDLYGAPIATDVEGDLAGTPDDPDSGPGSTSATAWADLTALYCAHDGVSLFIYVDLPAYRQDTSTGQIVLIVDNFSADGADKDPWDNAIYLEHAEKPDYIVRGNIPGAFAGPNRDDGLTALVGWTPSGYAGHFDNWSGLASGEQSSSHVAYRNDAGLEIKIDLEEVGAQPGGEPATGLPDDGRRRYERSLRHPPQR